MSKHLTRAELEAVDGIHTYDAWVAFTKRVKDARGGAYPPDWHGAMIAGGLMGRVFARWGGVAEMRSVRLPDADGPPAEFLEGKSPEVQELVRRAWASR